MTGHLFSLDGPDGCGKTTVIDLLRDSMDAKTVFVRMPGGTAFGENIRAALKNPKYKVCPIAERLAFAADCAQALDELVMPALRDGLTVVTDRWSLFTDYAYGITRGATREQVTVLHSILPKVIPDVLFILLPPFEELTYRKQAMAKFPNNPECRIENLGVDFARKVYGFYSDALDSDFLQPWQLAHESSRSVVGIRGSKAAREVALDVQDTINGVLTEF